jgi:hypothetical protein
MGDAALNGKTALAGWDDRLCVFRQRGRRQGSRPEGRCTGMLTRETGPRVCDLALQ